MHSVQSLKGTLLDQPIGDRRGTYRSVDVGGQRGREGRYLWMLTKSLFQDATTRHRF